MAIGSPKPFIIDETTNAGELFYHPKSLWKKLGVLKNQR